MMRIITWLGAEFEAPTLEELAKRVGVPSKTCLVVLPAPEQGCAQSASCTKLGLSLERPLLL